MRTGLRRAALDALMDLSDVVLMTLVRGGLQTGLLGEGWVRLVM